MGPRAILPQEGSVLSDSQNSCDLNWTYTCTPMNPVSKSISSLNLVRQLCAGSEAAAGPFFPVTWTLLGKGLLLLILLGVLGTWYIQTQFPKASAENLQFKNYFSKISFDCSTVFYKWNHKRPVHSKMFKSLSKHPDKEHISCYTQISVSWQRKTSQQRA
nr:SLAM family member 5-like isoform X3 [Globicephala melas]